MNKRRRSVPLAAVVIVLTVVASAVWIGLRIDGLRATRDIDDGATVVAALAAAASCFFAAGRDYGRMRRFWLLLAGACSCWALAEITWSAYDLVMHVPVPVPSWADVGYLGAIPVAIGGLLSHPALHSRTRYTVRSLLDGLILATGLAFLSWTLVIGPLWKSTDLSTLGGVVALAYPFGDVVMVFVIVTVVRRTPGQRKPALWCLLGGLLVMALTDSTYTYLTTNNSYASGDLIDIGWIAAYLMIALAAFSSEPERAPSGAAPDRAAVSAGSLFAPFVPAVVALGVMAVKLRLGPRLDSASMAAALILVMLALTRQTLLARELAADERTAETEWLKRLVDVALGRGHE